MNKSKAIFKFHIFDTVTNKIQIEFIDNLLKSQKLFTYLFDPFGPLCSDMMPPCCLKNQFRQKGAVSGSAMEE